MTKQPLPHQQRVIEEYKELNDRLIKLTHFIFENGGFFDLPDAERERLTKQHKIMCEYSSVLQQRILAF